jgi:hypothetical protein
MIQPSNYWKIHLPTGGDTPSKNHKTILRGEEFFRQHFPHLADKSTLTSQENKYIYTKLLAIFDSDNDVYQKAIALLCLRCYISERILIACKMIPQNYNIFGENLFSYTDLLPFVLNDDGRTLVILDSDRKTQLILEKDGTTKPLVKEGATVGRFFTVEILRKFNRQPGNSESLDNWVTRLTNHNHEVRSFLWSFGLATPTDWALLCKSVPMKMSGLLRQGDREIINAFQAVYQKDRLQSQIKGRCTEPTANQISQILRLLQQQNITLDPKELLSHFHRIAEILREDWLYRKTGSPKTVPTELYDNSTQNYQPNPDLPYYTDRNLEEVELEKLGELCKNMFEDVLKEIIPTVIHQRVENLQKSRGYKDFATKFTEGLRLYYQENMSMTDIGQLWGINWSKARRIFEMEDFIDIIQAQTESKFSHKLLQLLDKQRFHAISNDPEYLTKISIYIREFACQKTFNLAKSELALGKRQVKNSLLAKLICAFCNGLVEVA